jgi:hypothetical protein
MKSRRPFVVVRRKKFVHRNRPAAPRAALPMDGLLADQSGLVLYGQG